MDESQLESSVSILCEVLADQHVLYMKTRNFHWNLKGPRFHDLHELFEKQYTMLEKAIDETAERIRALGGVSPGSMKEFLELASLSEHKGEIVSGDVATELLTSDHNKAAQKLRKKIGECEDVNNDVGTADFLTSLLMKHEETAWMLRSMREA